MIHNFIGAIIEAWEEVKINRARVILSLIGVGAAVWAMATVIALGTILNEAQQRVIAHWNGQPGTITVIANVRAENGASGVDPFAASVNPEQGSIHFEEFRQSVLQTVEKLGITIWTTKLEFSIPFLDAPDFDPCPPQYGGSCPAEHPSAIAVDPSYFSLHAHKLVEGRFMDTHDGQLQMNPVVVNESTWAAMGSPALATYPRLWLDANHNRSVTVVGVIKNTNVFEGAMLYVPAQALPYVFPDTAQSQLPSFLFLPPSGEEEQAKIVAQSVLGSFLGEGYEVMAYWDEGYAQQSQQQGNLMQAIVAGIGGIVILLGALGLLTMSIVTVKNRVREIGIRRAVGASARRVFFAVFLESVVATTAAGFVGVALSVITIRILPTLNVSGFLLAEFSDIAATVAYPMSAALIGVGISATVGALCGIIPATIAVKMRPIDAIRF
ncbi:ABC transporter permease [Arcanobacterium pinnipediorum]|uniref:ABC transporter permease n=1 Tax=Arcanobacterium pinnipediorum TaxID=1503041 RepID=A0ABY5AIW2_9ACTO|nr:ABC transporter permease [Arcanobacterium pinnipediorum]USR79800.1 ABC transporter permease [Arcanobacterium pinnipediorum]